MKKKAALKQVPITFEIFAFWKNNKKSGFFELNKQELIKLFQEWLPQKGIEWHEYYSTMDALNCFISEKLHAVGNSDNDFCEYEQMVKILRPIRNDYVLKMNYRLNNFKHNPIGNSIG